MKKLEMNVIFMLKKAFVCKKTQFAARKNKKPEGYKKREVPAVTSIIIKFLLYEWSGYKNSIHWTGVNKNHLLSDLLGVENR